MTHDKKYIRARIYSVNRGYDYDVFGYSYASIFALKRTKFYKRAMKQFNESYKAVRISFEFSNTLNKD